MGEAWEEGLVRASPMCHRPLAPLTTHASPTRRGGRRPSAAGSHALQRGEAAELRGQAAAQAVAVEVPASERGASGGMRGMRGEREGTERRGRGGMGGVGAACQPYV